MAEKGEEEGGISKELEARYRQRLTFLKNGKEYYKQEDFVNATKCYTTYLNILAEYKSCEEKKLTPDRFDKEKELPELLLVSHTYWDLAKIYDRTPRLYNEFLRVLNQFVSFSSGFKYQTPNAGMLKRFVKKKKLVNKKDFQNALDNLKVSQKKCYIATYCFGPQHETTQDLYKFKNWLMRYKAGKKLILFYYYLSPKFITICEEYYAINKLSLFLTRPLLKQVSKILPKS